MPAGGASSMGLHIVRLHLINIAYSRVIDLPPDSPEFYSYSRLKRIHVNVHTHERER